MGVHTFKTQVKTSEILQSDILFKFISTNTHRQALTEASVLSDVLHIIQHHRQYMTIDPVYVARPPSVPVRAQYILKRQVWTGGGLCMNKHVPLNHWGFNQFSCRDFRGVLKLGCSLV